MHTDTAALGGADLDPHVTTVTRAYAYVRVSNCAVRLYGAGRHAGAVRCRGVYGEACVYGAGRHRLDLIHNCAPPTEPLIC